jgi:hypothetical protein
MGEYEDRYPDAYGRDETAGEPPPRAELNLPPRQHRQSSLLAVTAETAPAWQHSQARLPEPGQPALVEPSIRSRPFEGSYRGVGPRGYIRSDRRIYEDICDRLTENPFIDASDIDVTVRDRTVTLAGSVDNDIVLRQAVAIAGEAIGVAQLHNDLIVRTGGRREASPGDLADRALPLSRDR